MSIARSSHLDSAAAVAATNHRAATPPPPAPPPLPPPNVTPLHQGRPRRPARRELPASFDVRRDRVPSGTDLYRQILRLRVPGTAYYLHPSREQVYRLHSVSDKDAPGDDDGGSGSGESVPIADSGEPNGATAAATTPDGTDSEGRSWYFEPLNLWGCPRVDALVHYGDTDAVRGERTSYDLTIGGVSQLVNFKEYRSGEAWDRWGGLGIAHRREISDYAKIVEQQMWMAPDAGWNIPTHQGRRATGWTLHEGRHALILPDGRLYGAGGQLEGVRAYIHLAPHHVTPYSRPLAIDRSTEAQSAALRFHATYAQRSLSALVLCAHISSIVCGIFRGDYSVIVRGGTGRGKTGMGNEPRNLTGDFPWETSATASLTGPTAASMEKHIHQIKHAPMLLDDQVMRGDMTPSELAELGRKDDMVIRAHANNTPMRPRQTRNMEDQPANTVDATPVLTVEQIPPEIPASTVNRCVLLDVGEGEIDKHALRASAAGHRPGLRGVGHGLIAYLAGRWDLLDDALAAEYASWHERMRDRLAADFAAALGARDALTLPSNVERLPSNGAHLLLAAQVLAEYCAVAGVECPITPDALYADMLAHLVAQAATIVALETGGNDGVLLDEWAAEQIHAVLAGKTMTAAMQDGSCPPLDCPIQLGNLGWLARGVYTHGGTDADAGNITKSTIIGEGYQQAGPILCWLDATYEHLYCDKGNLYDALKRAAAHSHRPWRINRHELGKALVDAGLVEPDSQGKSAQQVKISGRNVRLYCISTARIWAFLAPDGGDGDDGSGNRPTPAPPGPESAPESTPAPSTLPAASTLADDAVAAALLRGLSATNRQLPRWQRAAVRYATLGERAPVVAVPDWRNGSNGAAGNGQSLSGPALFAELDAMAMSGRGEWPDYAHAMIAALANGTPLPTAPAVPAATPTPAAEEDRSAGERTDPPPERYVRAIVSDALAVFLSYDGAREWTVEHDGFTTLGQLADELHGQGVSAAWLDMDSELYQRISNDAPRFCAPSGMAGWRVNTIPVDQRTGQLFAWCELKRPSGRAGQDIILAFPRNGKDWPWIAPTPADEEAGEDRAELVARLSADLHGIHLARTTLDYSLIGSPSRTGRALAATCNRTRRGGKAAADEWWAPAAGDFRTLAPGYRLMGAWDWRRPLTPDEEALLATGGSLHAFDKRSCYPSAAASLQLPIGEPVRMERPSFVRRPALWQVRLSWPADTLWNGRALPLLPHSRGVEGEEEPIWLWTPQLDFCLRQQPAPRCEILAAVMWPDVPAGHAVFDTWAERLYTARTTLATSDPAAGATGAPLLETPAGRFAYDALKAIANKTLGLTGWGGPRAANTSESINGDDQQQAEPLRWHHREWHALVIAEACTRMWAQLRRLYDKGYAPLSAHIDSVTLLSPADASTPPDITPVLATDAARMGSFRHEWSAPGPAILPILQTPAAGQYPPDVPRGYHTIPATGER